MTALFQPYHRQSFPLIIAAMVIVAVVTAAFAVVLALTEPSPAQREHAEQVEADEKMLTAFASTFAAEQAIADFALAQGQAFLAAAAASLHRNLMAGADMATLLRFAEQALRLEAIYLLDAKGQTVGRSGAQSQPEWFRDLPEVKARLAKPVGTPWVKRVPPHGKGVEPLYVMIWPRPKTQGSIVMVQTAEDFQLVSDWSSLYTKFLERFLDSSPTAVYIALLEPNNLISHVISRDAGEVGRLKRAHKPFKVLAQSRQPQVSELASTRGERLIEICYPFHAAGERLVEGAPPRGILIAGFRVTATRRPFPNLAPAFVVGVILTGLLLGLIQFYGRRTAALTTARLEHDTQNILETISSGLLAISNEAVIVAVNSRAEEITGRGRNRIVGQPYQRAFEDEKELNYVLLDTLHNGRLYSDHELAFRKPDGTTVPLRVSTSRLELSGSRPGAIALIEDISEQRRLEARLRRNERLSAMGQLAHGVAHEIRNPLNAIEMTAQHVQTQFAPADAPHREKFDRYVRAIREEVRRLDLIVRRFLEIARPPESSLSNVDVNGLVEHALLVEAEEFTRYHIQVVKQPGTSVPHIKADKAQLQQALLNLIINAIQAVAALPKDAPRVIKLSTAFVPAQAPDEADGVEITVSDSGVGIKPEHRDRVFDPYFTTKQSGTGLGLALVYSITLNHGGLVEFESAPGAGTTFRWLLPVEFGETL
ncbi:MAG: PAS domain S-box protein [Verrucomicrobia bacterium]|nr:PAS domain S-box protein [Verrucomicrobiota bacterium]